MTTRNLIVEKSAPLFLGMNTSDDPTTLPEGYLTIAYNANLTTTGGIQKRKGYARYFNSGVTWAGKTITAGIEYVINSTSSQIVLFGTDGTGSGGVLAKALTTGMTNIATSLSGTVRPSLVQVNGLLFAFNGTNSQIQLYNGTATRQMGITLPSTAPTGVSNVNGSLTSGAKYVAAYTYYNSITGAESSPSPVSTSVTVSADPNDGITWTVVAGSATTADTIRLYRSVNGGNVLFLDNTASITATTITSTQVDAGLGVQISFENNRITDLGTPRYAATVSNRLFLSTDSNEIRFSRINTEGFSMPESFATSALVETIGSTGTGDTIIGLTTAQNRVIVIKERSLGVLDQVAGPIIDSAEDSSRFIYREIATNLDLIGHFAAASANEFAFILGKTNVYLTDGSRLTSCANSIKPTIKNLGFSATNSAKVSAITYDQRKQVMFSCMGSNAISKVTFILKGDYSLLNPGSPDFGVRWTMDTEGINTTTHPGMDVRSYVLVENSSTSLMDLYFGGVTELYKADVGDIDNSSGIYFKIIDRPRSFNNPFFKKLLKTATVYARGNAGDYDLSLGIIYDLSQIENSLATMDLDQNGETFGSSFIIIGTYVFPTSSAIFYTTNMHNKAIYGQLTFSNTNADQPVDLFNWSLSAGTKRFR